MSTKDKMSLPNLAKDGHYDAYQINEMFGIGRSEGDGVSRTTSTSRMLIPIRKAEQM